MLPTDAAIYLPITDDVLDRVLSHSESLEAVVSALSVAEIATLVLVQCLPAFTATSGSLLERRLAELIAHGNTRVKSFGAGAFAAEALQLLDRQKLRAGSELLSDFAIMLLDAETVGERAYLTADGNWKSTFLPKYKATLMRSQHRVDLPSGECRILSPEQTRIFWEVRAQIDDHLHVQGYAGSGKSFLIKSLLTLLQSSGARILVLAERRTQLNALLSGTNAFDLLYAKTFGDLVIEMVPPDRIDPVHMRMRRTNYGRAPISDDAIVRHLGIQPGGEISPLAIARIIRGVVWLFCRSDDAEIGEQHIPRDHRSAFDQTTKLMALHYATELWKATLLPPSREFQPPVRDVHRVKWAALAGLQVPRHYTHVLIDECHDLARPMLQILNRSAQAVISLGDEYQNLQGQPRRRASTVRLREVTHSIRSGYPVEDVVNPIIAVHPGHTKLPFHGNPLNKTEISYYREPQIPERSAVILVHNLWSLFEWAQRLADTGIEFEMLSDPENLKNFVQDCIELFRRDTRPRHGAIFRFRKWDSVARQYHADRGFQYFDARLRKGYSFKDWEQTSARFVARSQRGYALGHLEDVRNREFEGVMLAPDVVDHAWASETVDRAAAGSEVYVAVTRARHLLIVPDQLRNWIEEISA